jgi:uncharacterized protein (DUF849 family)
MQWQQLLSRQFAQAFSTRALSTPSFWLLAPGSSYQLAITGCRDSSIGMTTKEFSARRIQACLNGNRSSRLSVSLPITPEGLASDAGLAANLGFFSVHVHPRDDKGRESLTSNCIGAAVTAIRAAAPSIEIGVSTGAWIEPDLAERIAAISSWKVLPDVASVNLFEHGADRVIQCLLEKGIGIEAGLATLRDAQILVQLGLAKRCKRILVEVHGQIPEDAVNSALEIEQFLHSKNIATPQLHHGYEQATWAVICAGFDRGHSVRIGLEDTEVLPTGSTAASNEDLFTAVVALLQYEEPGSRS